MGFARTTTITRLFVATALLVCISFAPTLAPTAGALEEPAVVLDRVRPVDTSSPRDTLRNFLDHFDASVNAWRAGDDTGRRQAALLASASLDFSKDPTRGRYIRRFEKMVMLKEVLDRLELPPYSQIPGKEEVEAQGVSRWTIPHTLIDIVQIEEGPDAGEFLISQDSVANLGRYYEIAKDLPYGPEADVGLYEELRASPGPLIPKRWIDGLPLWTKSLAFGYPLWQWVTLLAMSRARRRLCATMALSVGPRMGRPSRRERRERLPLGFAPRACSARSSLPGCSGKGLNNAIWLWGVGYDLLSVGVWSVTFGCAAALVIVMTGTARRRPFMQRRAGSKRGRRPGPRPAPVSALGRHSSSPPSS